MIDRGHLDPTHRKKESGDALRRLRWCWQSLALLGLLALPHTARGQQPVLALGETMERPAALSLPVPPGHNRPVSFVLTSSVPRKVTLVAFGRQASFSPFGSSQIDRELSPEAPLTIAVKAATGPLVVVALSDETQIDERDLFDVPATLSQLGDRALDRFLLAARVRSPYLSDDVSLAAAALTARLFLTLDPAFIVYATRPLVLTAQEGTWRTSRCGFDRGEPLLLLSRNASGSGTVLRATGQRCSVGPLPSFLTATRPATSTLLMPPPVVPEIHQSLNRWDAEEFLSLAGSNPRVARYQKQKEIVRACSVAERKKLDPDARAHGFDVVSYAGGRVGRVESLARRLDRRIAETCKQAPLFRERDAIRAALNQTYLEDSKRRLAEIAARLGTPPSEL